ncbi:DUF2523 domain-containing protein [Pseudomonas sp. Root401]|uniref:DUF2523 domain-containing protein n=1 Tax=Pseudomonas sp. Root401 TaxID=1736526 RepID=UPI00070EDC4A|nr:DUF2523 domain-containing protein [Pseudomonas sp. Root401]KQW13131.1 hypothetical protein ASC85_30460 [Pseudomonas sp. Root401]
MPFALISALVASLVPLAKMVLKALGVGVVSYVGINLVLTEATDVIMVNILGLPVEIQQILGLLKVDVAINIILSAITTKLTLNGINKITDSKSKLTGI